MQYKETVFTFQLQLLEKELMDFFLTVPKIVFSLQIDSCKRKLYFEVCKVLNLRAETVNIPHVLLLKHVAIKLCESLYEL
jgi:hypothetical protein